MLPPSDLEGKVFKRVMKGYNTVEVDEHIDFIIQKYRELYRAYNDLEKKHAVLSAELQSYKASEMSIRETIRHNQEEGELMLEKAKERSEIILRVAREECDGILDGFKKEVAEQIALLGQLRSQVAEFKADIFTKYQQHIEYLESISIDAAESEESDPEEIAGRTVGMIVTRANAAISEHRTDHMILEPVISGRPEDLPDPAPKATVKSNIGSATDRIIPTPSDPAEVPTDGDSADDFGESIVEKEDVPPAGDSGDTMKFRIIPGIAVEPDTATDEDIIFDKKS